MKWAYGITTVPERIENGLLQRTIDSLAKAGFPDPHVYVDGMPPEGWSTPGGHTCRTGKVRAFGNWCCAVWEMFCREPNADRYAVFQDDFVSYRNLREYLERCHYPDRGYLNLYTFKQNEKNICGWYESNQLGKGAVALVFSSEAIRALFSTQYMIDRPMNATRGHKAIDGGIVSAFKKMKPPWKEYVHNPSLVQHVGDVSAVGNRKHPQARTFRGEDFDAVQLLEEHGELPDPSTFRIGIAGFIDDEVVHELIVNTDIDSWIARPRTNVMRSEVFDRVDTILCPHGNEPKLKEFLRGVDVVVLHEHPVYQKLLAMAKDQYKRTVLVTSAVEPEPWFAQVDQFVCTTLDSYNALVKLYDRPRCAEFSWPSKWHTGADKEFSLLARTGEHRVAVV